MPNEAQANPTPATDGPSVTANELQARLFRAADRSGYEKWLLEAVLHATLEVHGRAAGAPDSGRDQAVAILCVLVEGLGRAAPGQLVPLLRQAKLESSEDLPGILAALAEAGLFRWGAGLGPGDFDGIFHTDRLDEFARAQGLELRSQRWEPLRRRAAWTSYAIGGGVVLSAWVGWLPKDSSRVGLVVLFVGWLVFSKRRNP
ncbi:MAG: hypothetical protein P1V81_07415 [Planctomycetota bacterium]|nr:hypothetical protein [Planctomycetota bacterium]